MELPQEIRALIEERAEKYTQKQLFAAAEKLSRGYRENSGTGRLGELSALSYACVRMPATYAAAVCALTKVSELYGGTVSTMLDAGTGCGAVCCAADAVFPELSEIVCIEREPEMAKLGAFLLENTLSCGCEWRGEPLEGAQLPRRELVTASYVVNELSADGRARLTRRLWEAAEKLLVIIEPGTPSGFANLKEIRAVLLSAGARILAPCPDVERCPLPEDDWCHFTARVARSRLHKRLKGGDVPYEDEKFCYIAAVRGEAEPCAARVLRHPGIDSGKITLKLCTGGGIIEKTVTKKDGAQFKKARKAGSGDSF